MTSTLRRLLAAALMVGLFAGPGRAEEADQANLDILRDTIRANRKALVAASLTLTDEESGKFWPLYDRYATELKAVNDRLVKVIQDYTAAFKDLSNEKAMQLAGDYLSAEDDRVKLRRKYLDEFGKVVPGRKAVRLFQIENKIDALVRYDLAAEIPVVEE